MLNIRSTPRRRQSSYGPRSVTRPGGISQADKKAAAGALEEALRRHFAIYESKAAIPGIVAKVHAHWQRENGPPPLRKVFAQMKELTRKGGRLQNKKKRLRDSGG